MVKRDDTEFERLALAFPALKRAVGISPWSPNQLDIWATEEATEPAAIAAAQFLLSLWNRNCRWQCGSFDMFSALEKWDVPHRSGFLESVGRLSA
jgi:hypothetical protein